MEVDRPSYYAVIPADVRYDDTIPANAKLLYGEISALVGSDGCCYASNQYFSNLYGMAEETIARLITKLEKAGHIKRVIDRDETGQISNRKLYLRVSVPEIQPLDKKINTPRQKNQGGIDEKVKGNNVNNKNNIYIPPIVPPEGGVSPQKQKRTKQAPLEDGQLQTMCADWIRDYPDAAWDRNTKNALYLALVGFYAPREKKKQEPSRTRAAFTALTNRLSRYSGNDPLVMIDMLERATTAGWKSVFPLGGDAAAGSPAPSDRRGEVWL